MTAPDPLHTVTDSATAFEERLTFFADDAAVRRNIAAVASTGLTEADVEGLTDRIAARVAHGYEDQEAR